MSNLWSAISDGFVNLSHWLSDLGDSLGKSIKDMWHGLADGLSDLWDAISLGFKNLSGWLSDLGDALAKSIKDMWDGLTKNLVDLWKSVGKIIDNFVEMLSYINPFSDKFILKVAFIPKEGHLQKELMEFRGTINRQFAFLSQIGDSFDAVRATVESSSFQGWKVRFPHTDRELQVVNGFMIDAIAPKMRYFIGGFIVILMSIYVTKRGSRMLGAGKG